MRMMIAVRRAARIPPTMAAMRGKGSSPWPVCGVLWADSCGEPGAVPVPEGLSCPPAEPVGSVSGVGVAGSGSGVIAAAPLSSTVMRM